MRRLTYDTDFRQRHASNFWMFIYIFARCITILAKRGIWCFNYSLSCTFLTCTWKHILKFVTSAWIICLISILSLAHLPVVMKCCYKRSGWQNSPDILKKKVQKQTIFTSFWEWYDLRATHHTINQYLSPGPSSWMLHHFNTTSWGPSSQHKSLFKGHSEVLSKP